MRTVDKEGRILVTPTDVSTLEDQQLTLRDLMHRILLELRKQTVHLAILSQEEVTDEDVRRLR